MSVYLDDFDDLEIDGYGAGIVSGSGFGDCDGDGAGAGFGAFGWWADGDGDACIEDEVVDQLLIEVAEALGSTSGAEAET